MKLRQRIKNAKKEMDRLNTIQAHTVAEKVDLFNRMHKQMVLIKCKSNRGRCNELYRQQEL